MSLGRLKRRRTLIQARHNMPFSKQIYRTYLHGLGCVGDLYPLEEDSIALK